MIEYNYQLDKFDGVEVTRFTPIFQTTINNVSKFSGKNSSGKTTLMDMIALSLYGRECPGVIGKLKSKLEYLETANNSEFIFDLVADNGKVHLRVHTEKIGFIKGNKHFSVVIEESTDGINYYPLLKEDFEKKYRLIYDMPDHPMERIQELVSEAYRELEQDLIRLDGIRYPLRDIISDVEGSRNEEYIKTLETSIQKMTGELEGIRSEFDARVILEKKLSKYCAAVKLKLDVEQYNKLQKMINNLSKEQRKRGKATKAQVKSYESALKDVKSSINSMLYDYVDSVKKIKNIKLDEKYHSFKDYTSYWEGKISDDILKINCSGVFEFEKIAREVVSIIDNNYDLSDSDKIENKKLLKELICVLESYTKDDMSVLNMSIIDLYEKLKGEYSIVSGEVSEIESLVEIRKLIIQAIEHGKEADKKFQNLGPKPEEIEDDEGTLESLSKMLEDARSVMNDTEFHTRDYGINFDNYLSQYEELRRDPILFGYINYDPMTIGGKLINIQSVNETQRKKIQDIEKIIETQEEKLKEAKEKETHPLQEYLKELIDLKKIIETSMVPKLKSRFNMLVNMYNEEKVPETVDNSEFLQLVWKYLGERLETIQHLEKIYKVDKIDMNARIVWSGKVQINFSDMGTGESQLAYLLGLLKSDDPRIAIALFDEVDHMDDQVLSVIQSKMKEMVESGQLIIGLMAAPGLSPEVS